MAIGTGTLLLDLFCDRAELVALRDTLAAAVADLDTARHAIHDDTDRHRRTDDHRHGRERPDGRGPHPGRLTAAHAHRVIRGRLGPLIEFLELPAECGLRYRHAQNRR